MNTSKIRIRCPKSDCRSLDITITGTSNCKCGNCGEEFIFPSVRLYKLNQSK